ncbi:hypothetical protein GCM10025857_37030 [Alicyclobacillus contaminans]|nr:hypothetical protein GCM10025857_37030 [Alicyclobacillus contaminans]
MTEYTTSKGVWNGWYWRLIGGATLAIAALQLLLKGIIHYPLFSGLPLAVMIIVYIIVPRAKERTLANAIVAVVVMYVVSAALAFGFEWNTVALYAAHHLLPLFILQELVIPLLLGVVLAYVYLRLSRWSDRKRAEIEAKRRQEQAADAPPRKRVHSKKRRKKKR